MRTRRFFGNAIAMLCMIAIIGSGFALWVFQYKTTAEQSKIGLSVEQAVNVGEVTAAGSFSINFDQTNHPDGWNTTLNSTHKGITINFNGTNKVAKYDATNTTFVEDNMAVKFTVAITISADLDEYIDFSTEDTKFTKDNETTAHVIYFTSTSANEFDWSKVTVSYRNEPANYTDYNAFKSVVENGSISVTYTAEVVGK